MLFSEIESVSMLSSVEARGQVWPHPSTQLRMYPSTKLRMLGLSHKRCSCSDHDSLIAVHSKGGSTIRLPPANPATVRKETVSVSCLPALLSLPTYCS